MTNAPKMPPAVTPSKLDELLRLIGPTYLSRALGAHRWDAEFALRCAEGNQSLNYDQRQRLEVIHRQLTRMSPHQARVWITANWRLIALNQFGEARRSAEAMLGTAAHRPAAT